MTTTKTRPPERSRKLGPSGIPEGLDASRLLSPRRKTSQAADPEGLAREQLEHFGIDPASEKAAAKRHRPEAFIL